MNRSRVIALSENTSTWKRGALVSAAFLFGAMAFSLAVRALAADESSSTGLIQVRPIVEISGSHEEILLGDLVEMKGIRADVAEKFAATRLADAPKFGETRAFTDVGLIQIIGGQVTEMEAKTGQKISLRVPSRVTVMRKAFRLNPAEVEAQIQSQLKEMCSACEFEIAGLSLPVIGTSIPDGSTWKVKLRREIPKGNFSFPLEVNHLDGTRRMYWVSGSLAVRSLVPVASRSAMLGERLNPEDFTMQMKDITFATDSAATATDISASIVGRQVQAGQIVWRNYLRREMAVKVGDALKITAGNEEWQVSIDGIAQSAGYIGDLIRIKIPRTQKIVSGLIKDKGLVEVR